MKITRRKIGVCLGLLLFVGILVPTVFARPRRTPTNPVVVTPCEPEEPGDLPTGISTTE